MSQDSVTPGTDLMPEFEPHEHAVLGGTLVAAAPTPRSPAALRDTALLALIQLVQRATRWPKRGDDLASRIGDYRFLVLEFTPAAGPCLYVQMWSEPTANLLVEVGPGTPEDPAHLALMAGHSAVLCSRGLQIGGKARNYTKRLPIPRDTEDAGRIAHELLGLLIDVLAFDGTVELTYKFQQSTHLAAAYTVGPLRFDTFIDFVSAWGLPVEISDQDAVIRSRSHGFNFSLQAAYPHKKLRDSYWEIHCHTTLAVPTHKAPDLIAEINGSTRLLKAADFGRTPESQSVVSLAYGINLAGGVTPDHIRNQIFEWLHNVQIIRDKVREKVQEPGLMAAPPASELPSSTMH